MEVNLNGRGEKMYFITCFTKYEIDEKTKIPNIGSARTFGYYENRDVAIEAVEKNWYDIQERIYRYAVIEHIPEGLYELADERLFFEWDEDIQQFKSIGPFEDCWGNYAFG